MNEPLGVNAPQVTNTSAVVGEPLPGVEGFDYQNNPHVIRHPAVVIVVAHWCDYCQREVAALNSAVREDLPQGNLYLISTWQMWPRAWPPAEALRVAGFPGEVIVDTTSVLSRNLGIDGVPYAIATDRNGIVREVLSGEASLEDLRMLAERAQQ